MKLQIAGFAGEIPRTIPRLLNDNFAQVASNTKLEDGSLTPIRRGRFEQRLDAAAQTIYKRGDEWMSWPGVVSVVPAPVAADRLYITGDGVPKLMVGDDIYDLALPAPTGKPVAVVSGTVDEDLSSTILYAYTWVTAFDEESEPSPLSAEVIWSPGLTVTVTGFSPPPTTRGVNRMRVYRSQTSSLGVTELYFIAEREASTAPFTDDALPIVEPIPSTAYNNPPDDLAGLVALPNGIMAGFSGKQLCFSEPFIPHAWPEKYRLSTDYPIVGLGSFGSSLAVMTTGQPYVVTGTSPDTMSMEKLELNLPCINARGIVDLGYVIAYPSHDGLVTISSAGANVVTKQLMTRDQWLQMNPYSFVAGQFSGRYMASYAYTDLEGVERRGVIIFDLSGSQPFKISCPDFADAMFYEIEAGALYLLKNSTDIYEWDAASQPFGEQTWMSKRFVLPTYTNFGAILIDGEDITSTGQRATIEARNRAIIERNQAMIAAGSVGGEIGSAALATIPFAGSLLTQAEDPAATLGVTIFADGKAVDYVTRTNEIVRLKSGFQARTWEIEVRGNVQVTAITLANTPDEIAEG